MPIRAWAECLFVLLSCVMYGENPKQPDAVHRRTEFAFDINAPFETVVPLFGADKERLWADGWDPQFVHPQPAKDEAGAVFTLKARHSSVWINTVYDLEQGHVQYACFAGEAMVTLIDIHIRKISPDRTRATVVYERTALQPEANQHVNQLADGDQAKGPEWEAALRTFIETHDNHSTEAK